MKEFPSYKLYQPEPGHPDWDELMQEAAELASRIAENAGFQNPLHESITFHRRKFKAVGKILKSFRGNKRKLTADDHNFTPLFYIWTMTNRCNFDCAYCSNHRGSTYPELHRLGFNKELTTEEGFRLIEIMQDATAIYFCGGEPTLRKDLPELLDYSAKLGMYNMINTNGSIIGDLLVKPRYRNFLRQMDVIIVSLDALNIEQLAGIYKVGTRVARKTLRNLLALKILQRHVPFKLVANTVISGENLTEAAHILDWCNDLRITLSPVSANIGCEPDHALLANPSYLKLVDKILQRAKEGYPMIASGAALSRLLKVEGFSCYPAVFDHIDTDGRLFWPCKAYGDAVMIDVLKYDSLKTLRQAAAGAINPGAFHGDGPEQCRGHCAWMQNCVTDMYARGLTMGMTKGGLLREVKGMLQR